MSVISDLGAGAVQGIVKSVADIADDLHTSDEEIAKSRLDAYEAETKRLTSQTDINKIEAASDDRFVKRARPFILWVCGIAFAYVSLVEPILRFCAKVMFGYAGEFPVIDTYLTLQVLFGILGLGVMRSFDKKAGTSK